MPRRSGPSGAARFFYAPTPDLCASQSGRRISRESLVENATQPGCLEIGAMLKANIEKAFNEQEKA